MTETPVEEIDALVIGAGVTGLYQPYCLLQLGVNASLSVGRPIRSAHDRELTSGREGTLR